MAVDGVVLEEVFDFLCYLCRGQLTAPFVAEILREEVDFIVKVKSESAVTYPLTYLKHGDWSASEDLAQPSVC